jgi:DNA-3-methyladenine glycosylase
VLEDGPAVPDAEVLMGPRVGVDYAGEWARRPWRYWVAGSAAVSRPRRAAGGPYVDPRPQGEGERDVPSPPGGGLG